MSGQVGFVFVSRCALKPLQMGVECISYPIDKQAHFRDQAVHVAGPNFDADRAMIPTDITEASIRLN